MRGASVPTITDRERAALAWAEAVTLITHGHLPEPLFEEVCSQLSDKDLKRPKPMKEA
jgi:alkylhydroperoxidase family enzyme